MMKSFLNLLCIGCVACAFTACSDDDNSAVIDPTEGGQSNRIEDATIQFRLSQSSPGTYAYNGFDDATPAESTISGEVQVYVFDDQGIFEKYSSLNVTGAGTPEADGSYLYYSSDPMTISSGTKYFYLFANMSGVTPASTLLTNSYRKDFEKEELDAAIGAMTTNGSFYIGTLEPGTTTIQAQDNPQTVNLTVGRLAAKVILTDDEPVVHARENLNGVFDFDNAKYQLVNLAKDYYLVGQSSSSIGTTGNYMESPYFTATYSYLVPTYITPPSITWDTTKDITPGNAVYTKENTHSTPMNGTATSIQYRIKYTPKADVELYGLDGTVGATPAIDGSFWMAAVGSNYYFFNADPSAAGTIDALGGAVDVTTVVKYEEGFSYYTIPIADSREIEAAAKYSVIRNHSYTLTLKNLYRLGSNTPDIEDPDREIDEEYDIEFEIKVLPWFKVVQDVNL